MRSRRQFLRDALYGMSALATLPLISACPDGGGGSGSGGGAGGGAGGGSGAVTSNIANLGSLGAADANGLQLPAGFSSRIVARSGDRPVPGSAYAWHGSPDGGATFEDASGGWIYVSNAELSSGGGVGALRFAPDGHLIDAYPILSGTTHNCAGGPTPWNTWLSCEEKRDGLVYECDPFGRSAAVVRPALGTFQHEAAAVDPMSGIVYLTEDEDNGGFYRFVPAGKLDDGQPDLENGSLQIAEVIGGGLTGSVKWHTVPDPSASSTATRRQVADSTRFDGGEGIWFHEGAVSFSTKNDERVWAYDVGQETLELIYDAARFGSPPLRDVDNVTASRSGDVLVAEDPGELQIVAITPGGSIVPVVKIEGHRGSEVTGPAFDPSGTRLYFSSQRGTNGEGVTFEVSGPFHV